MHTGVLPDRQAGRQAGRDACMQPDRWTDRQTDIQAYYQADILVVSLPHGQIDRQTARPTDRQID